MHGRIRNVPLSAGPADCLRQPQHARGDDEWTARAVQNVRERLDGGAINSRGFIHAGEVMLETEMQHTLGACGRGAQAAQIGEAATHDLGAKLGDLSSGLVGSSQPEHVMPSGDEFSHAGGTDPT